MYIGTFSNQLFIEWSWYVSRNAWPLNVVATTRTVLHTERGGSSVVVVVVLERSRVFSHIHVIIRIIVILHTLTLSIVCYSEKVDILLFFSPASSSCYCMVPSSSFSSFSWCCCLCWCWCYCYCCCCCSDWGGSCCCCSGSGSCLFLYLSRTRMHATIYTVCRWAQWYWSEYEYRVRECLAIFTYSWYLHHITGTTTVSKNQISSPLVSTLVVAGASCHSSSNYSRCYELSFLFPTYGTADWTVARMHDDRWYVSGLVEYWDFKWRVRLVVVVVALLGTPDACCPVS